ncbi:MAG: two-component regulator propeller domain-containing protein [Bacteroidota bacterium]|nr:two-component regulator propeller domain-containing protein [Bacteroidota bacterium]
MRSFNIYIFFTFFVLTGYASFSQTNEQLALHKIDEQNGLSDNNVQCVYKDINNFVWIGTASGLNLMDGSDITVFKHEATDSNSISSNDITAITGNYEGLIWIGTQHGLNLMNPFTREFIRYPLTGNSDIKYDHIGSLAIDKNDNLFIGTPDGLFRFDPELKKIVAIKFPGNKKEQFKNNSIAGLITDQSGVLWIINYNGLWSYHKNTNSFIHEISSKNDSLFTPFFTYLMKDHSGMLWIGTWDKGLKEFNTLTKTVKTYSIGNHYNIIAIAEVKKPDGKYILWLNGNSIAFDPSENKNIKFSIPLNISTSLKIDNLYSSKDNWLWIGTHKGLYFYNPAKAFFRQHTFSKLITNQDVSLLEWNNKILVSGSGKNFLKAYNDQFLETDDYGKGITSDDVSCLSLKYADTNKVIAGTSKGIANINLNTHHLQLNHLDFLTKKYASGNFITNLVKDKNKYWWVFPWRQGIWTADSSFNNFHQVFNNFLTNSGIPKSLVIANAVEDNIGNMWFADLDEGIIFYNRQKNKFSKPFIKELGIKYLASQILYYKNNCYSFSETNIFKWNPDSVNLQIIEPSPQMDRAIVSIAIDSIGHLWMATRKGLFVYNLKTKMYEHFTSADGLVSNDMDGTLCCLKNGTMIFGSPGYLTSFQPATLLASIKDIPDLMLSEVVADNKPVIFDTANEMNFGHTVNNFIFKWAVTDYNNPLKNHYYYQLKGIDKEWHYAGTHGDVEFANLSPGDYTLLLKGENANEVNAKKIITLHFAILFPFWRTWWFFSLLFMGLLAFFYILYRYRLSQILKIEKLRNRISLDLHDDIGSTLSSISILSEMAIRQKKESQTIEMLGVIKENSISLMERMDDIVWSINPHNDSLESLFLRIKSFAAKLFEAKEINYTIHINENLKHILLPMEYRQHIYLIMKEAINNLVKYSGCTEAEIDVRLYSSQLKVLIKDNGKGFNVGNYDTGNGLGSMKKRAEEMNATLDILSEADKGTAIVLSVKIK